MKIESYLLNWENVDGWREMRAILAALDIRIRPVNAEFNHLVELGLIKDPPPLGPHICTRWEMRNIPCPDGNPGCTVQHLALFCVDCGKRMSSEEGQ